MVVIVTLAIVFQLVVQQLTNSMMYGGFHLGAFLRLFLVMLLSSVAPPLVIMGVVILSYIRPLHKVVRALSQGEKPPDKTYLRARKVIIRLPWLIIALTVGGVT
ncbi:MAG: hypothetical protein V3S41_01900 [Spirochaetia bacterium]